MSVYQYISASPEQEDIVKMRSSIRKWTLFYLIYIGVSVLAIDLLFEQTADLPWTALLVITAILAWFTRIPAMFIIFGVMLGWAASVNLLGLLSDPNQLTLLAMASIKVLLAVILIGQYRKYRHLHAEGEAEVLVNFGKASGILSILCLIIPLISCMGLITYIGFIEDVNADTLSPQAEQLMDTFFASVGTIADMAVFALGLGIAATTVKDHPKRWAVTGIVMSSLVIVGYIGFLLLAESILFMEQQGMLPAGG